MAITETWDVATPQGSEDPKNGDDRIRELKRALVEILRNGGHKAQNGPVVDAEAGRHVCGEEAAASGTGAATGEWYIYDTDGSTKLVTVGASTASPASRITATSLTAYFENQRTIAIALNGTTGVQPGVYFENRSTKPITILGYKLVAGTGPSGGSLVVNVLRNASGYTNPGSGGTSTLTTPATDLVITTGNRVGSETTAIVGAQSVLSQGDALYFDITTLNTANDIVLYIRCR